MESAEYCQYQDTCDNLNVSSKFRVKVEQGDLRGVQCEKIGVKYLAFKGIPYAKPPLGELRFQAPRPPDPWKGVRDADKHGPVCPQYFERLDRIEPGSEDCLYLNVYTKSIDIRSPKAVMVWIHGGAFYTGSGDSEFYGPEFLIDKDIVLVTINYRLEVLGFLCLDIEEAPGNAGLKDQVAALKWVRRNISAFGGDKDNITIFGCSAGGASVTYHLLSDMSKGLFHKAIVQSGSCLNDWSYNLYSVNTAFQLAKSLGKDTEDVNELLNFYRTAPVETLTNVTVPNLRSANEQYDDAITFAPVIEKKHLKCEKFLTDLSIDLVRTGKIADVPLMIGYTSGDGIEIARHVPSVDHFINENRNILPRELKLKLNEEELEILKDKVIHHYFRHRCINDFIRFTTDAWFAYNTYRLGRYASKYNKSQIFGFVYAIESDRNITKQRYKMEHMKGVCHTDELHYLFNVTLYDVPMTEECKEYIDSTCGLWTNFAKNGIPTSTYIWMPFTSREPYYCCIGKTLEMICSKVEGFEFWDEIYSEMYENK